MLTHQYQLAPTVRHQNFERKILVRIAAIALRHGSDPPEDAQAAHRRRCVGKALQAHVSKWPEAVLTEELQCGLTYTLSLADQSFTESAMAAAS